MQRRGTSLNPSTNSSHPHPVTKSFLSTSQHDLPAPKKMSPAENWCYQHTIQGGRGWEIKSWRLLPFHFDMKRSRIESAFHFNRWLNTKCLSMCFMLWFKHQFAADPSIHFFVQLPIEWGHDHNSKYFLTRLSNCNVDTSNARYKKKKRKYLSTCQKNIGFEDKVKKCWIGEIYPNQMDLLLTEVKTKLLWGVMII